MADTVLLGGKNGSRGSGDLDTIASVSDAAAAAAEAAGATADGLPVSPAVAARRYGAAAGQSYRNTNPDAGAP